MFSFFQDRLQNILKIAQMGQRESVSKNFTSLMHELNHCILRYLVCIYRKESTESTNLFTAVCILNVPKFSQMHTFLLSNFNDSLFTSNVSFKKKVTAKSTKKLFEIQIQKVYCTEFTNSSLQPLLQLILLQSKFPRLARNTSLSIHT